MTHTVPLVIVALYLASLFGVAWWAKKLSTRGGGGLIGYLLAGRQLPPWVSAAMLAGLAVGGASTIGVAERAYTSGIAAGWYNAAWAAGALAVGLVAARRYRRLELTTLPELLERVYSTRARVLGVVGQLIMELVVTALQYVAGGAILSALMPGLFSFRSGMLVTAIVFVGVTMVGGFWAAGLTNVVNVTVIYTGLILGATLTVGRLGGLDELVARLPEAHPGMDFSAVGVGLVAAWFVVMITQAHSTQAVIQVGFATADERGASKAYLLGSLIIFPVGFLAAIIGMAAAVVHPGITPAEALPRAVLDLSPFAAGLILAGLWAADVSTASALLLGSAALVVNDVIKRFFAPSLTAAQDQTLCRLTVLALSAVTFIMALTVSGILKILLIGLSLSSAFTLIVLMTMFCPSLCRRSSASWTLGTTMVALVLWLLAPDNLRLLPHPIYFTWLVSLVSFFCVAVVDPRRITAPTAREQPVSPAAVDEVDLAWDSRSA